MTPHRATSLALEAIEREAIVVDLSHRSRGRFDGAASAATLNGLLTNDIVHLVAGEGCYAFALTPKGRMLADVRVFRRANDCLVDLPGEAADTWWGMVRKYVNPRLTRFVDMSTETASLGLMGPQAAALIASVTGLDVSPLAPYAHMGLGRDGVVARILDGLAPSYMLMADASEIPGLRAQLIAAGATVGSFDDWNVARVEAGRPAWGVDMDETTLAQEALVDELDAVSYEKGCYTGQETLARVHYRGHVNRRLVGIRAPEGSDLVSGEPLWSAPDSPAGTVRSAVTSRRFGVIGLAMIRREVAVGARLHCEGERGEVEVVELPFR